jgi:broad specificity phosphatase PhoE
MTHILLVRHARPLGTWSEATDPGLDPTGHEQAQRVADELRASVQKMALYTSPLQRCRETAAPLAARWNTSASVLLPVAEIPSPPLSGEAKRQWLASGMQGTWAQLQATSPSDSPDFLSWRDALLRTLLELREDCVIFTHYIAINVAVGAAQGHDRVVCFRPGHASVTKLEIAAGKLVVRELGAETADGSVLLGK